MPTCNVAGWQINQRLLDLAAKADPDLEAAWQQAARAALELPPYPPRHVHDVKEQFLVLITCRDEKQQVELLERFLAEGLECKALVS